MIVKAVREGLGRVIVFFDYLTRPSKIIRSEEDQHMDRSSATGKAATRNWGIREDQKGSARSTGPGSSSR